jgi:hypothetical protein
MQHGLAYGSHDFLLVETDNASVSFYYCLYHDFTFAVVNKEGIVRVDCSFARKVLQSYNKDFEVFYFGQLFIC